jgi:hypothetical protein
MRPDDQQTMVHRMVTNSALKHTFTEDTYWQVPVTNNRLTDLKWKSHIRNATHMLTKKYIRRVVPARLIRNC